MKKIVLSLAALFILSIGTMHAQLEKGTWFISGSNRIELNAGKQTIKSDDTKVGEYSYVDFDFQEKAGYNVINNLPIGLYWDLDLESDKSKMEGTDYKYTTFHIGPFARYYFFDLKGLKPYAEMLAGFGINNDSYKYHGATSWDKTKGTYMTVRAGGGFTYFLNDYVGCDLFMGFNHESFTYKHESTGERSTSKSKYIYNEFLLQMGVVFIIE